MRLTRTDVVVGMSANDARELMRRFRSARPESAISVFVDTGERSDHEIARALHAAGYLGVKWDDLDGETWWETTTKGNALAQASFGRPITRATAQRHLNEVIARARAFNADVTRLAVVSELVVFGSFLDPAVDELGDLDLAVSLRLRFPVSTTRTSGPRSCSPTQAPAAGASAPWSTGCSGLSRRLFWPCAIGHRSSTSPPRTYAH
jgi:hypothetical protein